VAITGFLGSGACAETLAAKPDNSAAVTKQKMGSGKFCMAKGYDKAGRSAAYFESWLFAKNLV
jgi:hypothetical protein